MRGIATNRLGKVERHKKIKEGPCVFPFKYKRKEHRGCMETEKGKICATSVNERGTLQTYGYCEEMGVRTPPRASTTRRSPAAKRKSSSKRATLRKPSSPKPRLSRRSTGDSLDLGPYRVVGSSGAEGKEGVVLLVEDKDKPGEVLALKLFKKGKSIAKVHAEAGMQALAAAAGAAPRVVAVLETSRPGIVMERMGNTVVDVCKSQGGVLTEAQQKHILCAYERLDNAGVLHNDSNPLNLMVADQTGRGPPWGFVDYGFAKKLKKGDSNLRGLGLLLHSTKGVVTRKVCARPRILEAALEQGTTRPVGVGPLIGCELKTSSRARSSAKGKTARSKSGELRTSSRAHRSPGAKTKKKERASPKGSMSGRKRALKRVTTFTGKAKRWNEDFVKVLAELEDVMTRKGGKEAAFRAKAYRDAGDTLMGIPEDITRETLDLWEKDRKARPKGVGPTILSKLKEFADTGGLAALRKEYARPQLELTKVYGLGPKRADELVEKHGIKSVAELRAHPELLQGVQKIGMQHYEDILARIPRAEIDEYDRLLREIFAEVTPAGSEFMIVGSYRRGKKTSGDIDMIITNRDGKKAAFKDFIDALIERGIVTDVLSRGTKKCLAMARLPGKRFRRVDFLWAPPEEYAFAILYFTGSKVFNTVQRQRANHLGMTLNEHGLFQLRADGRKGARVEGAFPDEASIFARLGMEYREPKDRIDARSMRLTTAVATGAQARAQVEASTAALRAATAAVEEAKDAVVGISEEAELHPAASAAAHAALRKTPTGAAAAQRPVPLGDKKPRVKRTLKRTLGSKPTSPSDALAAFRQQGAAALSLMTEDELSTLLMAANDAYYCDRNPIMTDNEFDIVREYTLGKYPGNHAAVHGHAACKLEVQKNKVTLPYEMWSMDKIKPDTGALDKWKGEYKGPYVLSCKLDGVSGLYSTEGGEAKLYTRGNGIVGQDISHLIPFLKLPAVDPDKPVTVRGEFIVKKEAFIEHFAGKFANPRNFVAGLVNQKKIEPKKLKQLDFVAYEMLMPAGELPSKQMAAMESMNLDVVRWMEVPDVTNELLSELLVAWRNDYTYEIDGVICANDKVYPRTRGNPAHAFAFKMVLGDQVAEAKVLGVIWTASKHGLLKPRVQIDPVTLGGATISYATGFNAKFIADNKIGVGALVTMVRSGDVIPHIVGVVEPAAEPQMPSVPYRWNKTRVDVLVEDVGQDPHVREAAIRAFFDKIETDGVGPGTVKKFIEAGLDSVPKILKASKADFLALPGFKEKSADKVYNGIRKAVDQAGLPVIMGATAIFGRGLGSKTFKKVLSADPGILAGGMTPAARLERLSAIKGLGKKGAATIVERLPQFMAFMREAGLEDKLRHRPSVVRDTGHPLFGKRYVLTGFRDKKLVEQLKSLGAEQAGAVTKTVDVVVSPDGEESDTGKAEQAKKLGIRIMTPAEFKAEYGLE